MEKEKEKENGKRMGNKTASLLVVILFARRARMVVVVVCWERS